MKVKKEYIILIAVIVALSLYLFLRTSDRVRYELPKLPAVAKTAISKIEIAKKGEAVILHRSNGNWSIGPQEYPADTAKVETMLDIIENLTLTAMVSESGDYTRYQLDDEDRITVRAWTGETLAREFDVGKVAPSYRHTFVRLKGDDSVYHARENLRNTFERGIDDLRDKQVLAFHTADIQEIHLITNGRSLRCARSASPGTADQKNTAQGTQLPKEEGIWESPEGDRCNEKTLNRLLATLSKLRCQRYLEKKEKANLLDPIYRIEIKGPKDYHLSLFSKTDGDGKGYPATSSENNYPFLLPEGRAKSIMKAPGEMLEKPERQGNQDRKSP